MAIRVPITGNIVEMPGLRVFLSKMNKEAAIRKNPKKTRKGMYFEPMYFLQLMLEKVANIDPASNSQALVRSVKKFKLGLTEPKYKEAKKLKKRHKNKGINMFRL
jgi:hypothetical protein